LSPSERATVLFSTDTHAETARITAISATEANEVQARLLRVGTAVELPVAAGGTVTLAGSPAQVVLPAAGVQRTDGSVPTGNMRVRMTPINPAVDSATMPGDFTTVAGNQSTSIESFGALSVTLADSAGAALNLRPGSSATVRIPVGTRDSAPPATIPLFFFDNATGRWMQEGTATLQGTGASRYYEGTVTHFSTWNADRVVDTVRLSGCVADAAGTRVAGARVYSDGVSYSGTSSAVTDASGNFSIAVRRSSVLTLVGQSGARLTNTLRATSTAADSAVTDCLTLAQAGAGLTMKLTWGELPFDLDSHLYTPAGDEIYYGSPGNLIAAPFANLDVDDTSSYGPEVITISRLMVGTYTYFVNNFSGHANGPIAASGARVELNVPGRPSELFAPPTGETSTTTDWVLFALDVDARCNVTMRRLSSYSVGDPPRPPTSAPVYCQP
jgi:hypothetical protein